MSDENKKGTLKKRSNLESLTDSDVDLVKKFGHIEKETLVENDNKNEDGSFAEKERKEGVVEKDLTYQQVLTQVKKVSGDDKDNVKADAKKVSEITDAESRINNLVDLATHKGVVHAVKVAKHLDDNYILDELHDRLVTDELRDSLLKKGMIKDE